MAPVSLPLPPAGISTPTDDWTDDPSFDLSHSPAFDPAHLLSSPPSRSNPHSRSHSNSSSSSSRASAGIIGSPLRQSYTSTPGLGKGFARRVVEEEDEDGFDFPEDLNVGQIPRAGKVVAGKFGQGGMATIGLSKTMPPARREVNETDADLDSPDDLESNGEDQSRTLKRHSAPLVKAGKKGMGTIGLADFVKGAKSAGPASVGQGGFPEDLVLDDDEEEDQGKTLKRYSAPAAKMERKMGTISLTGTVIGLGPKGVGTITRLGAPISGGSLSGGGMAFAEADDMDGFDDDADFSALPPSTIKRLSLANSNGLVLPPPSDRAVAGPDALDDPDFDFDDELDAMDGPDEDQATLKAGATIKAMLPPPRHQSTSVPSSSALAEDDNETDLVLPLSMTNLTLATASSRASSSSKLLKPRASTSTIHTDWDSPSPSSASGSGPGSTSKAAWDDTSPWSKRPRPSETSATSTGISELGTPHRKGRAVEVEVEGEEEGEEMMMGLILPEKDFFEGKREGELNRILDQKRKPQEAFVNNHNAGWGSRTDHRHMHADESMEDGLLFDDPVKELTGHRLRQQKKARGLASGTVKRSNTTKEGRSGSAAAGSWEKAREAGWGRHTPLPAATPRDRGERGSGGLGLVGVSGSGVAVGHRSHSATAAGAAAASPYPTPCNNNRDFSSASAMAGFPPTSSRRDTDRFALDREPSRTRTQSMAPPPMPSVPNTPSSRLRHQKSHYQVLPPSPSPTASLARKQSLASLQDALINNPPPILPEPTAATPQKDRYHNSTSRLTMGTSSSRAKARPPISAVFPRSEFHPPPSASMGIYTPGSASSSSTSISGLTRVPVPLPQPSVHKVAQIQTQMVIPLGVRRRGTGEKKRTWVDGTELEGIADLEVDEPPLQPPPPARSGSGEGSSIGLGKPGKRGDSLGRSAVPPPKALAEGGDKRKKSNGGSLSKRRPRKAAGLIKHLGTVDKKKVVGDMTWNPATLRWEGNESILRDFDSIPSGTPTSSSAPARPALITHYTGGVVPLSASPSSSGQNLTASSTIRIVGDMKFDPERMCWVCIGEEEPDPFADMADDEDDEPGGGSGGGTITRAAGKKLVSVNTGLGVSAGSNWSSRLASESSAGGSVMSWEERVRVRQVDGGGAEGSGWAEGEGMVTEELWRECKDAEERHRKEMKGWGGRSGAELTRDERRDRERREEKRLWEIRYLAMRS